MPVHTRVVTEVGAEPLTAARKRLILAACILGSTLVNVDATVVNVALPSIREDLGGGFAGQQWTMNAYLVTLASLILVGGSVADMFGSRRIFSLGVALFGLTSALCAIAPTIETLVLARALQGVSGALLTPAALAVIIMSFPENERGRAVGAWTAWGAIGFVLGPLVGGQLVDAGSWRWIFAINLPLTLVTLVLVRNVVPLGGHAHGDGTRVDVVGCALCAIGLAVATFGLIRQPTAGFADPTVIVPLAGGILLLAVFLVYESRISHPMLPLGLFRRHNFAVGNLETLSIYAGLSLVSFFLVLFLQQGAGFSATAAGTALVPVTAVLFLFSMRFGSLADRYGPRFFMSGGPLVAAAGMALLARLDSDVAYFSELLPPLLLYGLGLTMTVAPLTATVLSGADEHNAGIASGVNNAIARLAGLLGIAVVGAVVAARYGNFADSSKGAFQLAMIISAALVATGGLLGLLIRNPKRQVQARDCAGGQLTGVPQDAVDDPVPVARAAAS